MSISSAVVSFFSYFQNLSVNIKLPHIEFPSWFTSLLDGVNNFIAKIQTYLLNVPAFDMRSQLVVMSVFIPLLLDILFIWFVQPFHQTVLNILDNCSVFAILFLCAYGYTIHWSLAVKILIGILAAYLIIRLFCNLRNSSHSYQMLRLSRDICAHYLYGIIPEIKIEYSIDDLNSTIQRFSKIVEISPQPPKVYITVNFFIVFVISLFASLYFFRVFPFLEPPLSKRMSIFLAIIFIIISLISLLVFTLRLFQKGRNFIMKFKQFCKRWGLRLLMLCFDLLYIPICSSLISHVNVKNYSPCPAGQYLYQAPDSYNNDWISLLIAHDTYCMPCNISNNLTFFDRCSEICKGAKKWHPLDDPTLDFFNDVIKISGGFIIWALVFVVFGIPILWFCVIQQNRQFAFVVNVYGKNPTQKWIKIVNRMKTTGIFLFVNYKYSKSRWSVLYLLVKFTVMILSTIASRFYKYLSISLSVLYLAIFISIVSIRPYLYGMNNLLDSILYFAQFIFSLNSSLALFNIEIPNAASSIVSIIITVVPVVSMIFLLFFRQKKADFENDPTYPQKLTEEEEEELERKRRIAKRKKEKQKEVKEQEEQEQENEDEDGATCNEDEDDATCKEDDENIQSCNQIEEEEEDQGEPGNDAFHIDDNDDTKAQAQTQNDKQLNGNIGTDDVNQPLLDHPKPTPTAKPPTNPKRGLFHRNKKEAVDDGFELEEFNNKENICYIPEDEYLVEPGDLCNINQSIVRTRKRWKQVQPEDGEESYVVNKRILTNRMTSMYSMLDIVVDGSTIEILTNVLNIAIICGMAAFGWYVGNIYANNGIVKPPVCHTI